MHDIKSLSHLLTPEGMKQYIQPGIIAEMCPVHPEQSGYHNAAVVMVRERTLSTDQIDMVAALLMLWKSATMSLHERMKNIHKLSEQLDAAQDIADDATRGDIETRCAMVTEDGREPANAEEIRNGWYDLTQHIDVDADFVKTAEQYLERRRLLTRHPEQPHLVRVSSAKQSHQPMDALA